MTAAMTARRGLAAAAQGDPRGDGQQDKQQQQQQQQQQAPPQQQQEEPEKEEKSAKQERHEELMGKLRAWMETSLLVQLRRVHEKPDMKLFEADEMLIPREDAKKMPPLNLEAITGQPLFVPSTGRVTLLLVSFNQLGFDHLPTWRDPVERHLHAGVTSQKQRNKRSLQIVTVSAVENRLYRAFSGVLGRVFEKTVDPRHANSTAAYYGDFSPWKPSLDIRNRIVGYAFLIDPQGLVRWKGCAECTFHESLQLIRCLTELLEEKDPAR
ncbi:Hypothetical Protein FCC1311_019222 [Hondaea fermentalgiana]|uniref:Mitochondrial ATPase complex subunit ATP10 n=1 Tax=Hondaea fermentalgiana TaxID=2315210 RepID=A0A2R5GAX4_9STRA|nr:Hypothetical Protein FCC1311_019222 [Hondaea fermentalgiana]|eukprot:GBG25703.1 Hypothetical Protein FCC1311_019222 [Hondaea fermentalgiana]